MPTLLPRIANDDEFDRLRDDEALWQPAMAEIATRHGLAGPTRLFPTGSAVVFAIGDDHVGKLHEPWHREHFDTEAACLRGLHGRLPVASPELVATGELEGWTYLVMSRVPGEPLSEVRDQVDPADLVEIARQTAELARAVQAVAPPSGFSPFLPWNEFIAQQRAGCVQRHRANGLPAALVDTLEEQLAGVDLSTDAPVLLHTELTDTNLMVARSDEGWRLSGVFDFEPSMLGHPLYDLPAITMFVAHGDPAACRAALTVFGAGGLDDDLRRRLLACTLLHRYSNLAFFLRQVGVDGYPPDWPGIAEALLGF